jgi:hypothetical protein
LIRKLEGKKLHGSVVDYREILNGCQGKEVGRCGLDSSGSGWELVLISCEHGSEP